MFIADEALAALETAGITVQVNLFRKIGDLPDAGIIGNPVSNEPSGVLAPKLVIFLEHVRGQRRQRLPVDFHDDTGRRFVREHPIQRKTFLHVKIVAGVVIEDDFAQQAVDFHHGHLAGHLDAHPAIRIGNRDYDFACRELAGLCPPAHVLGIFGEAILHVIRRRYVNFFWRINPFLAPASFDSGAATFQRSVQNDTRETCQNVCVVIVRAFLGAAKEFLKEQRIFLGAAEVLGAKILQISPVGERVLCDEINVAAVKVRVHRLAARRHETFAEDHVSRDKASGIGAAEQNRIPGHFRVDAVWRCEHVMPKPVAEPVVALFTVGPVHQCRIAGNRSEGDQGDAQRNFLAKHPYRTKEKQGHSQ